MGSSPGGRTNKKQNHNKSLTENLRPKRKIRTAVSAKVYKHPNINHDAFNLYYHTLQFAYHKPNKSASYNERQIKNLSRKFKAKYIKKDI